MSVYNKIIKFIYCSKLYELIYKALPKTRVYFIIKWNINAAQWRRKQYGLNVTALELIILRKKIIIINVYNLRNGDLRLRE